MKIIKNASEHVVLATWPSEETNANAQMVLEKAGRTCYQSEKGPITSETANKFVEARLKTGHYAVIEHGWRGYIIKYDGYNEYFKNFISETFNSNKFTYVTERDAYTMLVSANLETWRKIYKSFIGDTEVERLFYNIINDLEKFAPAIFKSTSIRTTAQSGLNAVPITSEDQLITDEEKLFHISHTIQYNNCSRGLTHELVRHRPPVYAQESTRYVDESDFKVIVPPHKNENEKTISIFIFGNNYDLSLAEWLELNEQAYTSLRNNKWKNEDARQILPTAIKAQIVMSCNLLERRYIYYRRTSFAAHWEIRKVMCDELSKFAKEKYPELFNMFVFNDSLAKDEIPGYCTSTEPDSFFCDK